MTQMRNIDRVVDTPAPAPGFIGEGHTAVTVIDSKDFVRHDPFIVLMDDRVDLQPGDALGAEHPHAGFETVTFVVEGEIRDRDEGTLKAGDALWMTAGSGVIHNEDVTLVSRTRILQLWLTLPPDERWTEPAFEQISLESVPVRREPGFEVRVYSGKSGDAESQTRNHVPVTMADVRMAPNAVLEQDLPATYTGFLYVLDGSLHAGALRTPVSKGQVASFDCVGNDGSSILRIVSGERGARVMLYAGQPQRAPIVMHGPFVGGNRQDIMRVSHDYMEGHFPRMSELAAAGSSV
ncbi:MAG TPA: pirin-like C-terminal cupin domain-containing protein [Gemmatimonadaceae bacterium]